MDSKPVIMPVPALSSLSVERKGRKLSYTAVAGEFSMGKLLKTMKESSGLTTRQLAKLMGIEKESLDQYFWQRRGRRGSSRLSWFLRFAEATGCQIYISFPSKQAQLEMQAKRSDEA